MGEYGLKLRALTTLLSNAIVHGERGAAHVRHHCSHRDDGHGSCEACEARWEVALAGDALRRGADELMIAADRAVMSMIRLSRAADERGECCVECRDIALDAISMRDELLEIIGRLLDDVDVDVCDARSQMGEQLGDRHAEPAGDAVQGEH
ncbi:MAG: hypothetical protein JWN41_27 [Thermoleophilia bacterium]|nr:hypothetical protein [Thermoleophilia bacterium]